MAASALGMVACVEYRIDLDLGAEGQARFILAIRDHRLAPQALEGMVGMMQAPWLRVDLALARSVGQDQDQEIHIVGQVQDLVRLGQLRAFHGVRCFLEPAGASRTLFQIERDPVRFRGTDGAFRARVRFPCAVLRTNGRQEDRFTVAWEVPISNLAERELRLWAIMEGEER